MTENKNKELFIELLRIFACFLVILYHSRYQIYNSVSDGAELSLFNRLCLNASFVIGRLAVPIFFIISGYFSFPVKGDTFSFLKKRLLRIVLPLIFWLFTYTIFFSNPKNYLYDLFNATYAPQIWYLYALIGITILLPIVSPYIVNATKKELYLYTTVWLLTLIFNGNNFESFMTINTNHQGMLFTNPLTGLLSFYGYFGYIVIGFFFRKFAFNKFVPFTLLIVGLSVLLLYTVIFNIPIKHAIAYCSVPNLFISSAIFLYAKQLFSTMTLGKCYSCLNKVASLTFGIYLIHWMVFQLIYYIPGTKSMNCILLSVITFIVSLLLTHLISLLPHKKYIIG